MDLKDAALMILIESAAHPSVAEIAQTAYDQLASGQEVDYRVLEELVGETRPYNRETSVHPRCVLT